MAPEQMRGTGSVDYRADIYSVGVVLYEMLTGELPIGRFEPPSAKGEVTPGMDRVVMKSLASEPTQRYQSARELKARVLEQGDQVAGDAAASAPARSSVIKRWTRMDLLLGPDRALKREDVPWYAMVTLAALMFCMFFPWFEGRLEYPGITSVRYEAGIESIVNGWQLVVYDLPMWLITVPAGVFLVMAFVMGKGADISTRALCVPAVLGLLQTGTFLGIVLHRDLEVQLPAVCGCLTFVVTLYLSTARRE